jgi:hypothetical protein
MHFHANGAPQRAVAAARQAAAKRYDSGMCRNIKTLHNFDPPATDEEIRASSLQYVRKVSGCTKPSQANTAAFDAAVDEVTRVTRQLLRQLVSTAPPKNREEEARKARERWQRRAERMGSTRS